MTALKLKNSTLLNRCFFVKQYIPLGRWRATGDRISASVPDRSRETVFAIASMRTCVAIATSGGTSEAVEVAGGKESVIVPIFDCTISVCV